MLSHNFLVLRVSLWKSCALFLWLADNNLKLHGLFSKFCWNFFLRVLLLLYWFWSAQSLCDFTHFQILEEIVCRKLIWLVQCYLYWCITYIIQSRKPWYSICTCSQMELAHFPPHALEISSELYLLCECVLHLKVFLFIWFYRCFW